MMSGPPEGQLAAPGAVLFARFAFPPNRLGHCGGDEAETLLELASAGRVDGDLDRLCRQFKGAMPYLRLIGDAVGSGPLDEKVVEAYWLGNALLRGVGPAGFGDVVRDRFGGRTARSEWSWLRDKPAQGALPHHSFHVLEVLPRVGLLRSGTVPHLLAAAGQCLVRPAVVTEVSPDHVIALARQLEMRDGKLVLSEPTPECITAAADGRTFVAGLRPGDTIATHWGWACDRLSPARATTLERTNRRSLTLANLTI